MLGPVLIKAFSDISIKTFDQLIELVTILALVEDQWWVNEIVLIGPETLWPAVLVLRFVTLVKCNSQHVFSLPKVLWRSTPYLRMTLFLPHLCLLLVAYTRKDKHIKADILGQPSIPLRHTIHIQLPRDPWLKFKLLPQELLPHLKVIKQTIILSQCLIWRHPPTID